MIVYKVKSLFSPMKRVVKTKTSDKNKRIYDKISKLRKIWWHFRTRWTETN